MIDIKLIRESPEVVKDNIKKKFQDHKLKMVDEILEKDIEWRKLKGEADQQRAERNKVSKEISEAKKAKKDVKSLMKRAADIPAQIAQIESKTDALERQITEILKQIPNILHPSVPMGKDASQNVVNEVLGKPKEPEFKLKNH